jgi:DNA-binding PadR family transcriptional regulator
MQTIISATAKLWQTSAAMSTAVQHARNVPAGEKFPYDPGMAALALGDASARVLCVGLLRQKPDTIQGLDKRLKLRFASANFTRGAASKSIPRLRRAGLVELVERGDKPTLDRYRITATGEAYFLDWLRQTELPPVVRDVMQCKLEFFEFEELPGVIEGIEEQAIAYGAAADIAHETLQSEKRLRRERKRRGQPPDWRQTLSIAKTKDAANLGNAMRDRLRAVVEELKEIQETFSAGGVMDE